MSAPLPRSRRTNSPPIRDLENQLLRSRNAIYHFLRQRGLGPEDAQDLTQETLTRACRHLAGFQGVSLSAWLYRIALNVSIDHRRRPHIRTVPLDTHPADPSYEEDPIARLEQLRVQGVLLKLLAELPERHQCVLRLRYYEDRSVREIAGLLGCTPVAAKLRLFRAVSALRRRCSSGAEL